MRLRILPHARVRMRERGISELDITEALRNHHSDETTPKNSIRYIGPGVDGRDLKVWVRHPGLAVDDVTVKSVAWKD
ncbi:DUF4258 domain-containing protein [Jatrophihabitans endophyticus]|uniref:DUF4258 domain-containing protein n=1 Tax=Jatrophihabitans endophyticus TaxID=1206085 RepID=UPI000933F74D